MSTSLVAPKSKEPYDGGGGVLKAIRIPSNSKVVTLP